REPGHNVEAGGRGRDETRPYGGDSLQILERRGAGIGFHEHTQRIFGVSVGCVRVRRNQHWARPKRRPENLGASPSRISIAGKQDGNATRTRAQVFGTTLWP